MTVTTTGVETEEDLAELVDKEGELSTVKRGRAMHQKIYYYNDHRCTSIIIISIIIIIASAMWPPSSASPPSAPTASSSSGGCSTSRATGARSVQAPGDPHHGDSCCYRSAT